MVSDQPERKQINFTIVPDEHPGEAAHLRQLLLDCAYALRLHADVLRGDAALREGVREAENQHVVRAPVRARVVVPVQFIPNLVAALQEHMRVFSDTYSNVGWTKGPVH